MPGENEVDQITRMFKLLGSPNDKIWPGYSLLPISQKVCCVFHPTQSIIVTISRADELPKPAL
jgi:cell division cycle 2-like protein